MGSCIKGGEVYGVAPFKKGEVLTIDSCQYEMRRLISEGGYAYIFEATDLQNKRRVAIKKMLLDSPVSVKSFENQCKVYEKLRNQKHIVKSYGVGKIQNKTRLEGYISMELGAGTLFDLIKNQVSQRTLFEKEMVDILLQIIKGLEPMHSLSITHCDLKAQNVLIVDQSYKLCDFGSACWGKTKPSNCNKAQLAALEQHYEATTTLIYRPPEMVDLYLGYDVGPQADIWMLGCNAYFLAFLKHPFQDEGKLAIVSANYSQRNPPQFLSQNYLFLIKSMLRKNPQDRPTLQFLKRLLQNWQSVKDIKDYFGSANK